MNRRILFIVLGIGIAALCIGEVFFLMQSS
jgi:hypothetical protein